MDPRLNPYAPGAGNPPPELAGRDSIIERASISLDRIRNKRSARSFIYYGLRGVGKTVLLNKIRIDAEARGFSVVPIEAPEGRSLPGVLVPNLRSALLKLSKGEVMKESLAKSMRALAGFAKALKVKYDDIEIGVDFDLETGLADSGDLDHDLTELLFTIGEAAKERKTALVIFIDELQYVPEEQLAGLISALHKISQHQLPVTMVAAGLPQLLAQMGKAKSYAERLFEFIPVNQLDESDAKEAIQNPANEEGVEITRDALAEIIKQTQCYPYFLQEWGKHSWDVADQSPIEKSDVEKATIFALADLDASFFRVRFDRLTPSEKQYLRAMAGLGEGHKRSGDIAKALGKKVESVGPIRSSLIKKGMIFSPGHGENGFTVPLFGDFMRRVIPLP